MTTENADNNTGVRDPVVGAGKGKAALTGCRCRRRRRRSRSWCTRTAAPGSESQRPGSEQTLSVAGRPGAATKPRAARRGPHGWNNAGKKKSTYESVAVDASAVGWQLEEPPHDSLVPFLLLPRRGRHCSLSERLRVGHSTASPLPCRARGRPVISRRRAPSDFRERRVDAGIGESRGSREIFCSGSRRSGTDAR